jgi:hypothetical protein
LVPKKPKRYLTPLRIIKTSHFDDAGPPAREFVETDSDVLLAVGREASPNLQSECCSHHNKWSA